MKKLLTLEDAAETLGVDYKTVYRLVRAGELPAGKVGRVYRIDPDDLEAYFESTKSGRPVAMRQWRCCVTGRRIVSELDIGGYDAKTGRPICAAAWSAGHRAASAGVSMHDDEENE
ncbi:MAG: helix-turn-helix domain-containing protein [Phycisphaerales bacterium]|nr:helix-turn-helix domain-containing protein [Phycisphaerales bacterium]